VAKIAFTGTTKGLTEIQRWRLGLFLSEMPGANELHHGVAEGADAEANDIARRYGWRTVGYPGVNKRGEPAGRADVTLDEVRPERPYLLRNRDIVAGASLLVAAPKGPERKRGSGTWATVRYARAAGVPVLLLWPDGSVEEEER
jgi:hypothetical protein